MTATKPPMDKQEVFDIVAPHLIRQGETSEGREGCLYRGERGLRCAIGVLIPDKNYNQRIEGSGVSSPHVRRTLPFTVAVEDVGFLSALQGIHDEDCPDNWESRLRDFATAEGLNSTMLDALRGGDE